jgi:hypothetical protein
MARPTWGAECRHTEALVSTHRSSAQPSTIHGSGLRLLGYPGKQLLMSLVVALFLLTDSVPT